MSPATGTAYTLHEGKAIANIKVLVNGDPVKGPYRLRVGDAQGHMYQDMTVGVEEKDFVFNLSVPGTGYFTAFLQDKGGRNVTSYVAYSVK